MEVESCTRSVWSHVLLPSLGTTPLSKKNALFKHDVAKAPLVIIKSITSIIRSNCTERSPIAEIDVFHSIGIKLSTSSGILNPTISLTEKMLVIVLIKLRGIFGVAAPIAGRKSSIRAKCFIIFAVSFNHTLILLGSSDTTSKYSDFSHSISNLTSTSSLVFLSNSTNRRSGGLAHFQLEGLFTCIKSLTEYLLSSDLIRLAPLVD
ncbi:wsv049 [White spot syndrome virus]|uniref:Wsv049 n=4 Tax=White spot syndrome virus TaxID=342409 RepID=Q8VBB8_WSSVS|nr:wsv049 [Shrimp white spot syndrome virus]AFX59426.1 wsv049 [White spot syndrome virus]AAL33053.1 wsv049 [Shrimp white spot syndrome virus]AAL88974.1 WSSV106 [Shrimp white spot syndrome virus]AWQ60238.1 wsv049 [Shrimp white spot syndrome virus]AWQ60657.1 wsv049 [Shrimp white spot syndrome virus]